MQLFIHMDAQICTRACRHVYMGIHIRVYIYVHIDTYVQYRHTHIYIHTCLHRGRERERERERRENTHMHANIYLGFFTDFRRGKTKAEARRSAAARDAGDLAASGPLPYGILASPLGLQGGCLGIWGYKEDLRTYIHMYAYTNAYIYVCI